MVFTRCAPSKPQFGAIREVVVHERGHSSSGNSDRAQQHAQANRSTLYRMSKHQIWRGQRGAWSSTSQGVAKAFLVHENQRDGSPGGF